MSQEVSLSKLDPLSLDAVRRRHPNIRPLYTLEVAVWVLPGVARWKAHQCSDPFACEGAITGEWFLGGGDTIRAHSRNHVGKGRPGPPGDEPGERDGGPL